MDNYEIQHGHEEEAQEPLGLFHCIAMDFGGDDNCLDESEFKAMWKAVFGEDAEAPMNFFLRHGHGRKWLRRRERELADAGTHGAKV